NIRIGHVQLIEINRLDFEPAQATFAGLAQVLGRTVRRGTALDAHLATLGGNHQIVRIGMQDIGDEPLAGVVTAIDVRGVEQGDTEMKGMAKNRASILRIVCGQQSTPKAYPAT